LEKNFEQCKRTDRRPFARNKDTITLIEEPWEVPQTQPFGNDQLIPLRAGTKVNWRVAASNSLIGEKF